MIVDHLRQRLKAARSENRLERVRVLRVGLLACASRGTLLAHNRPGDHSGGGAAKAGNAPSVKAAREANKKSFDKLRKNIVKEREKSLEKLGKAVAADLDAREALRDHHERISKAREKRDAAEEFANANPQSDKAWDDLQMAGKEYTDALSGLGSLEKTAAKTAKDRLKAREHEATSTARVIRKEVDAVNEEDGVSSFDVAQMRKRVEESHASNSQVNMGTRVKAKDDTEAMISAAVSTMQEPAHAREVGQKFLRETVNPNLHEHAITSPIYYQLEVRANAEFLEAGDTRLPGVTNLSQHNNASTVIHEFGHQIEHGNDEARELVNDFVKSRIGSEPATNFVERFPNAGYESHEKGMEDDFRKAFDAVYGREISEERKDMLAFYAGKQYEHRSTEIMSMGLELLNHNAPAFAEADPEWFDVVIGISTGRMLPKTRERKRNR